MTDTVQQTGVQAVHFWRAPMTVGLALAVFALGTRIPLSGLDIDAMNAQLGYSVGRATDRFSIFALWVMPLLTMLIYAEIAKLVVPPLAKWQASSVRNADLMDLVICVLTLAIAASQGYGLAFALEASGMTDGTAGSFMPVAIASFVGSTAILIWLAGRLGLPGLGGFWLLFAIPFLVELPRDLAGSFELMRIGAISPLSLLVFGACLAGAAVIVVFANRALSRRFSNDCPARAIAMAALLWPPLLAPTVSGYVSAIPFVLLAPDGAITDPSIFLIVQSTVTVLLIPLFVGVYARLLPPAADGAGRRPVLVAVAGVQMIICAGAVLLPIVANAPLYLHPARFIVFVTVMFAASRSFTMWRDRTRPDDGA